MDNRLEHEREHGRKISENAESVWNWASPAGQVRADRRAKYFVDVAKITKSDKVLEIGCGTGLFTKKVFDMTGSAITATDLSIDLLDQAKAKLPNASFLIDDAMKMSFSDESFDVVDATVETFVDEVVAKYQRKYNIRKKNN